MEMSERLSRQASRWKGRRGIKNLDTKKNGERYGQEGSGEYSFASYRKPGLAGPLR